MHTAGGGGGGAINGLSTWGLSRERTTKSPPKISHMDLVYQKNEGGKQQHNWGIYINAWAIDFNRKCVRMNNEGSKLSRQTKVVVTS